MKKGRYAKVQGDHWRTRALQVSLAAEGLNTRGESYCADVQSDGQVPMAFVASLCGGRVAGKVIDELIAAGWWEAHGNGFRIVGYLDRNISKADDAKRRDGIAKRTNKSRSKSRDTPPPDNDGGNERRNGSGNALHNKPSLTPSVEDGRQDTRTLTPNPHGGPRSAFDVDGVRDLAERRLRAGYSERYRAETGDAWMAYDANHRQIVAVALWAVSDPDAWEARCDGALDGVFADTWMREHRWPWKAFAKDPSRYADAGKGAIAERAKKHLETVKRRLAQEKLHGTEERVRELQAEYDRIIWGPVRGDSVPDRSRGGALDGAQGGRVPEELRRLGRAVG